MRQGGCAAVGGETAMAFVKEEIQFAGNIPFAFYETDAKQVMIHCHDSLELNYIAGGCGHYIIEDQTYPITPGDIFLINHREHHMAVHDGNLSMLVYVFDARFVWDMPQESDYLKPFFQRRAGVLNRIAPASKWYPKLKEALFQIREEYEQQGVGWELMLRAWLMVSLAQCYRHYQEQNALDPQDGRQRSYQRIRGVVEYIHAHFTEEIMLSDLSEAAMMSPSYLSAYFSSVMKMRIFDYIEQVRVNHARLLLRSTELSVLEVALQSGFRSSSYFNRVFKKIMGMTPGQYRQNKK